MPPLHAAASQSSAAFSPLPISQPPFPMIGRAPRDARGFTVVDVVARAIDGDVVEVDRASATDFATPLRDDRCLDWSTSCRTVPRKDPPAPLLRLPPSIISARSVSGAPAGITGSFGSEGRALKDSGTDALAAGDSGEFCTENAAEFGAPETVDDSAADTPDGLPGISRVVAGPLRSDAPVSRDSLTSSLRTVRRPDVVLSRTDAPSPGVAFGRETPPSDPSCSVTSEIASCTCLASFLAAARRAAFRSPLADESSSGFAPAGDPPRRGPR